MKYIIIPVFFCWLSLLPVKAQVFSFDANYFSKSVFPSAGFGVKLTPIYIMKGEIGFGNLGANDFTVGMVQESIGSYHPANGSEPPCTITTSFNGYVGSYLQNYHSTYSGINCSWINSLKIRYEKGDKKRLYFWANFGFSWTKIKDEINLEYRTYDGNLLGTGYGKCNFNSISFDPSIEANYFFTNGFGIKAKAGCSFYMPFENSKVIYGTTGVNLFSGVTPKFQLGIIYELHRRK